MGKQFVVRMGVCLCLCAYVGGTVGCGNKVTEVPKEEAVKKEEPSNAPIKEVAAVVSVTDWDNLEAATADPKDWPWWRGPTRNNVAAAGQTPPLAWDESKNIRWRAQLPGVGHGTPCLFGDRIFVAAWDVEQMKLFVVGLERATGNELWRTAIYSGEQPKIHKDNSYASASVICDSCIFLRPLGDLYCIGEK